MRVSCVHRVLMLFESSTEEHTVKIPALLFTHVCSCRSQTFPRPLPSATIYDEMVTPTQMHTTRACGHYVADHVTKEFSNFPSIAVSGYFVIAQFVVLFISTTNSHQACERKGHNGQPIKGTLRSQDTFRSIKASFTDI